MKKVLHLHGLKPVLKPLQPGLVSLSYLAMQISYMVHKLTQKARLRGCRLASNTLLSLMTRGGEGGGMGWGGVGGGGGDLVMGKKLQECSAFSCKRTLKYERMSESSCITPPCYKREKTEGLWQACWTRDHTTLFMYQAYAFEKGLPSRAHLWQGSFEALKNVFRVGILWTFSPT